MRLNYLTFVLPAVVALSVSAQYGAKFKTGDVLSSNASGAQGDYHVEYWKDGGSGSMTLGEGCDFSCQWGQVNNILFRKGVRPGSKDVIVVYEADYQPQGNSYLSLYGWFDDNPLVEYYIIESYGSWNPASDRNRTKHGSVESDSGTYDIFENTRNGAHIHGSGQFTQYWSIRTKKRTSGTITCGNHFAAWAKAGMKVGKFYEVSFNVEAYQSPGGKANVKVVMYADSTEMNSTGLNHNRPMAPNMTAVARHTPATLYTILGQKMTGLSGRACPAGQRSVLLNVPNRASGTYFSFPETREQKSSDVRR